MMTISESYYRKMYLIRRTEEIIENLFSEGLLRGTTHGCRGQEAIAVGLLQYVDPKKDYITGTHRSHGHYIALSDDPYPLIAELMGKKTGLVNGRGGSQHIRYFNFFTNGITGGLIPIAVGIAYSLKLQKTDFIVTSFIGDGAMNEGYVLEALNLAGCYNVPIVFVLENNTFAMSTITSNFTSGNFENRVKSFNIEYHFLEANDIFLISDLSKEIILKVRNYRSPIFIEFKTHRFSGHSKSDNRAYVPEELDEYWINNDPLIKLRNSLTIEVVKNIENSVDNLINNSVEKALNDPYPEPFEEYENY